MYLVTADVFLARPNPSSAITDEQEARAILKEIARSRDVITDAAPPEAGLGLRGVGSTSHVLL